MDREGAVEAERTDAMPKPAHNYDADFRVEAVNLLLTSGRPLKRVAAELRISDTSLRIWRDRALKKGGGIFSKRQQFCPRARPEDPGSAHPAKARCHARPAPVEVGRP